jgi:hypothetical protein
MSGFLGRDSVERARDRARDHFGKVTSGTLVMNDGSSTPVSYSNVYVAPVTESSALGGSGSPSQSARVYAFQMGETGGIPRADDLWTIDGVSYLIASVTTRCNADSNYAVHDCSCSRQA